MPPEVVSCRLDWLDTLPPAAHLCFELLPAAPIRWAPARSLLHQSSCQSYMWTHCMQVAALEGCGQLLPVLQALEDATALPELPSQAWPASQPAPGSLRLAGQGGARWYPTAVAARRSAGCQAALLRVLQSAVRGGWSTFGAAEVSGHWTGGNSRVCLVVTAHQGGRQASNFSYCWRCSWCRTSWSLWLSSFGE